jgi:DNA-binding transcriptional ArsR family regulator
MAPSLTTLDCFSAIAEPRRRRVLDLLAEGERPVNDLVRSLGWPQPQVSKHLGVLKKVGLVSERRDGRQRVYRMNGDKLKPIHEWVITFEHFWKHQLDRVKARAEAMARKSTSSEQSPKNKEQ